MLKSIWTFFSGTDGGLHATGTRVTSEMYCKTLKLMHRVIQNIRY
jgi:hypothetical protein